MSNQFSYELDERQIRLMMLNSESEYNEVAWQRFESTITTSYKPVVKTSFPKINFSISRSIIIPVLFIGLIGGLSILLFSFVDLKKKEEVVTEKALQISKPVVKPKTIATKPIVTPKVTPACEVSKPSTKTLVENKPVTSSNTTAESKVVIEPSAKDIKAITAPVKEETIVTQKENAPVNTRKTTEPKSKKKKKRIEVEDLPTITTPANLTSSNDEPELDLK